MPLPASAKVPGSDRVLANGATGATYRITKKDGTPGRVFRIYKSTPDAVRGALAARKNPRVISQRQAQQAFDKFYSRTRAIKRGPRKGSPRFKSPRGRKAAKAYDKHHTSGKVINDARYLHNPHAYDFRGVDTGSKARKPLSAKQRQNLADGRAKRARQVGGYWW